MDKHPGTYEVVILDIIDPTPVPLNKLTFILSFISSIPVLILANLMRGRFFAGAVATAGLNMASAGSSCEEVRIGDGPGVS